MTRIGLLLVLWFAALSLCPPARAIEPLPFRDAAEETRFRVLTAELRCVMCQNQSLADSNAPIAQDLRKEVLQLMQQGRSDEDIKAFLSARYSDFVLYRPPLHGRTLWLWLLPPALLLGGALALVLIVRRRAAAPSQPAEGEEPW